MRNITMIATKDHFLTIILADSAGDEITVSELVFPHTANGSGNFAYSVIGFGVQGSANTFHYKNDVWEHWGEYVFPFIESRYNSNTSLMNPLGAAATSNDTLYVGVLPKEESVSPSLVAYTNEVANTVEIGQLQQTTNNAFQLFKICQFDVSRDLNTFEKLETIEPTIPDSEITII